ncbi:MAG: family 31 glucosidase [Treponema sp.]|nr:family 31 glucosidase [Treponema sp.]
MILQEGNALILKKGSETLRIEAWGKDAIRVRSTLEPAFTGNVWGLTEKPAEAKAKIHITPAEGFIENGKIKACISGNGVVSIFKDGERILHEYFRSYDPQATKETCCTKIVAREWKGLRGGYDYKLTVRFEPNDGEKLYGMGQYQMPYLDLKGCQLELAQRNGQISVPFAVSSLGYGFMWNNPGIGRVSFGKNMTEWLCESTKEMDYWVVAGDTPAEIVEKYTSVVGRAPVLTDDYLGFWQCKLRYRTQEEVLTVARKYKEMGIHLDVIVIDFFHWIRQGDWGFDPEYWPDPKAMCDELHAMGTKVMISIWPSVDKKCSHYYEMADKGYLVRTERGTNQTYDFMGDCLTFDATNPEARKYLWEIAKKNYVDYGIDMFWLDNAEPDYNVYDWENYRYQLGPAIACNNIYPKCYNQAFYEGMVAMGKKSIVNLTRSGWFGSQKYGAVLWNGDVQSTWACLEDSVSQGVSMGLSGFPWWNTDIGGFMYGNPEDPAFVELLERWAQFAVFSPIMRLHGDRDPHDTPPLCKDPQQDYGGGYLYTGRPNEIWSYGEKAQEILEAQIKLRQSLVPYISKLSKEAAKTGAPVMRAMFYEFPNDEKCWELRDQYMFGDEYLVAPVLKAGIKSRKVYLPEGKWTDIRDGKVFDGGQVIEASTPIESIPVFKRG